MNFTFRERQLALAMCVGMPVDQIAAVLGYTTDSAIVLCSQLLCKVGYSRNKLRFALQVNAAVRELLEAAPLCLPVPETEVPEPESDPLFVLGLVNHTRQVIDHCARLLDVEPAELARFVSERHGGLPTSEPSAAAGEFPKTKAAAC